MRYSPENKTPRKSKQQSTERTKPLWLNGAKEVNRLACASTSPKLQEQHTLFRNDALINFSVLLSGVTRPYRWNVSFFSFCTFDKWIRFWVQLHHVSAFFFKVLLLFRFLWIICRFQTILNCCVYFCTLLYFVFFFFGINLFSVIYMKDVENVSSNYLRIFLSCLSYLMTEKSWNVCERSFLFPGFWRKKTL